MKLIFFILLSYSNSCFGPSPARRFICSYNIYLFNGEKVQFEKVEKTLNFVFQNHNDSFILNFQEVISQKGSEKLKNLSVNKKSINIINHQGPLITASSSNFPYLVHNIGMIKGEAKRVMIYSEFKINKTRLIIINCHWPSQFHSFGMRMKEALILKGFIKNKIAQNAQTKFLITGDFNLVKNELPKIENLFSPYLWRLKSLGIASGTYYYSKRSMWNTFDIIWTNIKLNGLNARIITTSTNSTLSKNKKGSFYLRPKKYNRRETHFDRQGPSDHFPICMQLPF